MPGPTYDQLFPGRFLKAGELGDKPVTLTIKRVYLDQLEDESGREKNQAVIAFEATRTKPNPELALNKTNAQLIVAMWGAQSDDWIGKHLSIHAENDPSGLSESGLCIRVFGSPDLDKAIDTEVRLPKRKPIKRKLVPTRPDATAVETPADGSDEGSGIAPEDF